jgi:hypothetical protein
VIPWPTLRARLQRDWASGQHVTIAAPTGIGKTHLAVSLAELSRHVLVLAAKRRDPLVTGLQRDGYHVTDNLDDLLWADRQPVTPKVVFWPRPPEKLPLRQRRAVQAAMLRKALDYADRTGGWTLIVDETMYLAASLGLEAELDHVWFQGRTQGLSVVACAQRPAHIPRMAFSQASYLFLGRFGDGRDIETLREISSTIPRELLERAISTLSAERHEFLFVDVHREELAITVAPPR